MQPIPGPKIFVPMVMMLWLLAARLAAAEVLWADDFKGNLGEGWAWVREHREAWRLTPLGLEVRPEPGNLWGNQNNARNVLWRAAPATDGKVLEFEVEFENHPTNQYEQADLAWYYDDSNMVKLGLELVDGKLSIVMGREEQDKTRTVAIIPTDANVVRLRMRVEGNLIRGRYCPVGSTEWRSVGECGLPAPVHAQAKISLQFYQGGEKSDHWARATGFRISRIP